MVRHLKTPQAIPAVLPHGPLRQPVVEFDPLIENAKPMEQNYKLLAEVTTEILQGLTTDQGGAKKGKPMTWQGGPAFEWKNVASPKATDKARSNPVSRAWKTPRPG